MRFGLDRMRRLLTALGSARSERFARDPRRRHERQVLDGAHDRRDPRGARPARRRLPLAAPRRRSPSGSGSTTPTSSPRLRRRGRARRRRRRDGRPRRCADGDRVTQFEVLTAAAFSELARARGRGRRRRGRASAAARTRPTCCARRSSVLTNVGLEHTRWLGPTIADIAREKLAVVRARRDARARRRPSPRSSALAEADAARGSCAPEPGRRRAAAGASSARNFAVARARRRALGSARSTPRGASPTSRRGSPCPGACRSSASEPLTILDGAHNPSGVAALAAALPRARPVSSASSRSSTTRTRPRCCARCCRAASASSARAAPSPRALPPATLASLARSSASPAEIVPEPRAALARARELAGPGGAVLATGSIYLVADLVVRAGHAERLGAVNDTRPERPRR